MEVQQPGSAWRGIFSGILIAVVAALVCEVVKANVPGLNLVPAWVHAPSTKDIIEPPAGKPNVIASEKKVPRPPAPSPQAAGVAVPSFVGMDAEAASRMAESLGLQVSWQDGADAMGSVESQWPAARQLVEAGSTVILGVRVAESRFADTDPLPPPPPPPAPSRVEAPYPPVVGVPTLRVPVPAPHFYSAFPVPRQRSPYDQSFEKRAYPNPSRHQSVTRSPGPRSPYRTPSLQPQYQPPYRQPYRLSPQPRQPRPQYRTQPRPQPQYRPQPPYRPRPQYPPQSRPQYGPPTQTKPYNPSQSYAPSPHNSYRPGYRSPPRPNRPPGSYRRHGV